MLACQRQVMTKSEATFKSNYDTIIPKNIQSKEDKPYYEKLENHAQFEHLQGEPLSLKYGGVSSVKVVYDIVYNKLYFINSNLYKYHFEFCVAHLRTFNDVFFFNNYNYKANNNRQFVLGNLNYYSAKNQYTLEFATSEAVSIDNKKLYDFCNQQKIFNSNLYFFVATNKQVKDFNDLHLSVRFLTPDQVYETLTYQPIVKKEAYGLLRKISIDSLKTCVLNKNDILLINGTPLTVAGVAGIVTTEFQTPLSHLCILSQNRKTPLCAYKSAWQNQYFNSLNNQYVHLRVENDSVYIVPSSRQAMLLNEVFNNKSIHLIPDYTKNKLIDITAINARSVSYVGGKAANLGELFKLKSSTKLNLPEGGFCVPIFFYKQHIVNNHLDTLIKSSLLAISNDPNSRIVILKKLRKAIRQAPINATLLHDVEAKIIQNNLGAAYRFRSSTTAEDIDGFNGAGLYDSKTGISGDSNKTIEKAIKAVWASFWNDRAVVERAYFNIVHDSAAMAILVHKSFGTEDYNAVAITKNIYREDMHAMVVNIQKGELPVVFSSEGMTTEQLLIYDETEYQRANKIIEYISYSSRNDNKPMLNMLQLQELYTTLLVIKKHYFYSLHYNSKSTWDRFAMDVEVKWIGEKLVVKQARVYND